MPLPLLAEVVERLDAKFEWAPNFENTLEVNPGTLSERGFVRLLELGLNRLSFGAQAFQPELLEQVGRVHSASDIQTTYRQARDAGFENLSLDLNLRISRPDTRSLERESGAVFRVGTGAFLYLSLDR